MKMQGRDIMQHIKIGVSAIITTAEGKILLGQRLNKYGYGTWAPPGGLLEYGESFEDAVRREVLEETGMHIGDLRQIVAINNVDDMAMDNHGVTIFMSAQYIGGEPQILEPEKCAAWQWFELDALPQPLFTPFRLFMDEYTRFCEIPSKE